MGILASAGPAPLPGFLNSLTGPLDHDGYWTITLLLLLENIGVPVVPGEFAMIGGAIFGGRPSKPERGNGLGKRAGSFPSGR